MINDFNYSNYQIRSYFQIFRKDISLIFIYKTWSHGQADPWPQDHELPKDSYLTDNSVENLLTYSIILNIYHQIDLS